MKNYGAIIRSVTVMAISAAMLVYMGVKCLSLDINSMDFIKSDIPATMWVEGGNETQASFNESASQAEESSKTSAKESSTATSQAVSASGIAVGKIINKTISPSSAGLSYGNVHIKNSTGLSVDIKSLLNDALKFKIQSNSEPQVLIMHTHTTESFMTEQRDYYTASDQARRTDENLNMIRLGNIVTERLNNAGIKALHDKTMHDYPAYNGSYTRAAKTINSYLKKYPSIKIVIDMHRDAVASGSDKVKLLADINGKKAAQVMLVMGSQSGSVTNFPNWKENLKLAIRFQQTMEVMYPGLARPLSLMSKNYNESLSTGSMLLEMGTDANTIGEVEYSAELVADALVSLLNSLK